MNDAEYAQAENEYRQEMEYAEPIPRAFCDQYEIHEGHAYRAVNGNTYLCSGFDAEDMASLEREMNAEPCEHGLSQSLCSGPMHYPAERDY